MRPNRADRPDDAGVTLVELLVTMMLLAFVSGIILTAVINAHKLYRVDDDEARGLADVRVVVERLGRDLRDARGVETGATTSQLALWIDYDSDYRRDSTELITWKIVNETGSGTCVTVGHCNVVRTVQGGSDVVEARTLISDFAFSYDQAAPNTRLVTVTMKYDAIRGIYGTGNRTVTFRDRLRNVA
jgi:prepilin-type N-terminal cleavage/methylation domain-containing protein